MLNLTVTFEIKEIDAAELLSPVKYDDEGNIVGEMTPEEREAYRADMQGRAFFGIIATVCEKRVQIRSEISSPNLETQREERAHMLADGLAKLGDSIYRNFSEL